MSIKGFRLKNGTTAKYDYNELDNLPALPSGGLSDEAKQALLALLGKVAYTDANGQTYYDALEMALYPPATLVSISAVYTQSGTVYNTDTLDALKTDLAVTAHYDDSTTATITNYTLSGTLTEGTSTITVTYSGKTTTFNVTVTALTVVDIVAVGTPSVSNGILTPSDNGYFITEEVFDPDDKPWKLRTKLYCTTRSSDYRDVICSYTLEGVAQRGLLLQATTDYLSLYLSSNNADWNIGNTSPSGMFTAGEWAWYEVEYDGTKYTISKSTDGENFTLKGTVSSATPLIGDFAIAFGAKRNAEHFNGTIDLTETKIYLDGQLWAEYSA